MIHKKLAYLTIGVCATLSFLSVWLTQLNHKNRVDDQPYIVEIDDFEPTATQLSPSTADASKKSSQKGLTRASTQNRQTIRHSKQYGDEWCLQEEVIPQELLDAASELHSFYERRGYLRSDKTYLSYDIPTLEALSKHGDQTAVVYLYSQPGVPTKLKKWAANQSLVHGDTILAPDLSKDLVLKALQNKSKDGDSDESRRMFLDGMVVAAFADRRHPLSLLAEILTSIFNNPEINIDAGEFRLNESDFSKIQYKAKLFQEDLDRKRMQLGLPPLDNTVPKIIQNIKNREMATFLANHDVPHWLEKVIPYQDCVKAMRYGSEQR